MASPRSFTNNETNIVLINTVDLQNNVISVTDRTGLEYTVAFRHTGPFFRVPKPGETWTLKREGYNFTFDAPYDLDTLTYGFEKYVAGDVGITAPSSLFVKASEFEFNGQKVGVKKWEYFQSDDYVTILELESTPIPASVQVFSNGILVNPVLISIEGTKVKVNAALRGWFAVYYDYTPEVS